MPGEYEGAPGQEPSQADVRVDSQQGVKPRDSQSDSEQGRIELPFPQGIKEGFFRRFKSLIDEQRG